jgi:protein subunit release factor A
VEQLAAMELEWARRRHLSAEVVACEMTGTRLARAVIEVAGPGSAYSFAMEHGVHRMFRKQGPGWKARVQVIPHGEAAHASPAAVMPAKRREGPLGLNIEHRVRARIGPVNAELSGAVADVLAQLARDLENAPAAGDVARVYGEDGAGATDPRTGESVARLKDVLGGELEEFLEAWRRRQPAAATAGS